MSTLSAPGRIRPIAALAAMAALCVALLPVTGPSSADAQQPPTFDDVPDGHVFAQEIAWLASTGITQGRGDGTFGVNDPVTRGAMAAFLYRYDGEPEGPFDAPEFDDVPAGHTFAQEIAWLASTGITQGRGDGTFGVNDPVTRGAMAAFLYRYDGQPDGPFDAPDFDDVPAGHTFAQEIAWLASTGITQGRGDGSFGVNDAVTRGAMAAFLYRYDDPIDPVPPPDPGPIGATWTRLAHDESVLGGDGLQSMFSVTAGGPGLVAVGHDDDLGAAAVWTSATGTDWQRSVHDEATLGGPGRPSMAAVTSFGTQLVAVGREEGPFVNQWSATAAWTSPDGQTWERFTPDGSSVGEGWQLLSSVTVGGPGLVAVGRDAAHAAVWTSDDGRQWNRVPHDTAVFGDSGQEMSSVTGLGPGLVAVGGDFHRGAAAVWTSADGSSWQHITHDETVFGGDDQQWMWAVTAGGPGLIAVGEDLGREAAAVWVSPDGLSWQRVEHDEDAFGGDGLQSMYSVAPGGPGLVAVGSDSGRAAAAVWTSADGYRWQRVPHDASAFGGLSNWEMLSVTTGPQGLVAVGRDWSRAGAAVWSSP